MSERFEPGPPAPESGESRQTEKATRLEEIHRQVEGITDGRGEKIDEGIRETVVYLNALDLPTTQSCEGHLREEGVTEGPSTAPWVDIGSTRPEGVEPEDPVTERIHRENLLLQWKLLSFLDEFYAKRQATADARLVFRLYDAEGIIRLTNQGGDAVESLPRDRQTAKRAEYRAEMTAFTEFLRQTFETS